VVGLVVHSTIERNEAKDNDDLFLKNKAYQPNRLRLYVRNKLAVENFMHYLKNTQAFGKYIEGEIHFNVLDSNSLPDIATANRQEFKENNDRIFLLIEILKPIVGLLIRERSKRGSQLRKEEKKYWESKKVEEEKKREKAERDARAAEDARQDAEKKYHEAEDSRKQFEDEVNIRKQQNYFLESALTIDERTSFYNTHVIKGNTQDIAQNLKKLLKKYPDLKNDPEFQSIAYSISKILTTVLNFKNINYDFERSVENENIGIFIEQYFKTIPADDLLKIKLNIKSNTILRFPYQEMTMMLYNIVSNVRKANATKLIVELFNLDNNIVIKFIDNGDGIKAGYKLHDLFELGFTYTRGGTGIGLAQIKDLIENQLNGTVSISRNKDKGATLEVIIPHENQL
jgi:uncharacterized protein YqkB